MRKALAVGKKEFRQILRDRRTLMILLFIPVFFLQIGIDADVGAFARAGVLRDAAVLLLVAIVGKLVSPIGAIGSPGDKFLIGLGMLLEEPALNRYQRHRSTHLSMAL